VVSSFVNFIFGSLFSLLMLVYTCSAALANIMAGILGHKPSEDRGQEQELVVQLRAEVQRLEEEMEVQAMCFREGTKKTPWFHMRWALLLVAAVLAFPYFFWYDM
jgi:hypothetical protein